MHGDNPTTSGTNSALPPQMLYRGLYGRVAKRLGVDASYVSRVARGERYSRKIETALREEIDLIAQTIGSKTVIRGDGNLARNKGKRLRNFIKSQSAALRQDFLTYSLGDSGLRNVKIPARKRAGPIMELLRECAKLMVFTPRQMRTMSTRAAAQHGELRRSFGFRPADMVEEYNLIRRCVFSLADRHFNEMDTHLLLHDISQVNEVLDLQLQIALEVFL